MQTCVELLTAVQVAEMCGVPVWCVRQLPAKGLIEPPLRVGQYRAYQSSDVPRIKKALKLAGYLPRPAAVTEPETDC
jgi:DNA-binding transcriptional MerR regulator